MKFPGNKAIRRFNFYAMLAWIVPGIPLSYVLRNSVPWLVFLSVYAIITTHMTGWRADVPNDEV